MRATSDVHWSDAWFYGVVPIAIYLALGVVAYAFWMAWGWETDGVAAVIIGLLLSGIRKEWDLVTWLAPKSEDHSDFDREVDRAAGG